MRRLRKLQCTGVGLAVLVGCALATTNQPNIIFILTDDQGYADLGIHGAKDLQTPHLDRLAEQSIRFDRCTVSSTCSLSRAGLMSGMYEFRVGVTHTRSPRNQLSLSATLLPELLHQAGYATGIFGKWHLGVEEPYLPGNRGFDTFLLGEGAPGASYKPLVNPRLFGNDGVLERKGYRTDIFYDHALAFIEAHKEDPFFCYIPSYAPHTPLACPEKFLAPYAQLDKKLAQFYGTIANVDYNIGRVLAKLDELGLRENTLVIAMNDNGGTLGVDHYNAQMRGCKATPWYGGVRAFSFWSWPAEFSPKRIDEHVTYLDLLPTLCDVVGVEVPPGIDGRSLAPLLREEAPNWPRRKIAQHVGRWMDRPDAHKYANAEVFFHNYHLVSPAVCDNETCRGECGVFRDGRGYSKGKNHAVNYRVGHYGEWELYDLDQDPHEDRNLVAERPELVSEMVKFYEVWWDEMRPCFSNE